MRRDRSWADKNYSTDNTGALLSQCVDHWSVAVWALEIMKSLPAYGEDDDTIKARMVYLSKARKDIPLKRPKYSGNYFSKKNLFRNIYGETITGFTIRTIHDLMMYRPPKFVLSENFERQRQANVVAAINRILRYRHQSWYIRSTLGSAESGLDPQAHPLQLKWSPIVSARELVAKDLIMEKLGEDIFQGKLKATVNDIIKGKDLSYGSNIPHTTAILIVQRPELESQLGDILAIDVV